MAVQQEPDDASSVTSAAAPASVLAQSTPRAGVRRSSAFALGYTHSHRNRKSSETLWAPFELQPQAYLDAARTLDALDEEDEHRLSGRSPRTPRSSRSPRVTPRQSPRTPRNQPYRRSSVPAAVSLMIGFAYYHFIFQGLTAAAVFSATTDIVNTVRNKGGNLRIT